MVSHCGFDFHFPGKWANDIDLFVCLYAICISSLVKHSLLNWIVFVIISTVIISIALLLFL